MTVHSNIINLNIGGIVFQTTKSTLTRFDGFFKTMMETHVPESKDETGAIFIDRDPKHFRLILNFMRSGHVAIPKSKEDIEEIEIEAEHYQLNGLVELCKMKNSGKRECKYLASTEDLINAYTSSTKKGVIVTHYPKSLTINVPSDVAFIAEKYGVDFDVYLSTAREGCSTVYCHIRRKSDGKVLTADPKCIDDVIKKNFLIL